MSERPYPDISDILSRKVEGRLQSARLSFADKLSTLDRLRLLADAAKQARASRSKHQSADTTKPQD